METKCNKRIRLGKRPTDIQCGKYDLPPHWNIYNAPRPIYGTEGYEWRDDCFCGVFYAAVDPDDEMAQRWDERNAELDARVIVYMSEEDALAKARSYLTDKHTDPDVIALSSKTVLLDIFFNVVDDGHIDVEAL